jgi:hypothetical protein
MTREHANRITAIYVGLRRSPLRVVIRRSVSHSWDRFDVFKPFQKIDGVVEVLKQLAEERDDFVASIVKVDKKRHRQSSHRTNRYVDPDRDQLYTPLRKDLVAKFSRRVGQLWLATNLNQNQMLEVIREACEAADVEYGPISSLTW